MEPLEGVKEGVKRIESDKIISTRTSLFTPVKSPNNNLKLPLDVTELNSVSHNSSKPTTASTRYGGFRKQLGKSSSQMLVTLSNPPDSPSKYYAKSHRKIGGLKSTDIDSSQEETFSINLKSSDEFELLQYKNKKNVQKNSFQIELAEKLKNTIGIDKANHYNFGNSLPISFDKESQSSSLINAGEPLGTIPEDFSPKMKKNLKMQTQQLIYNNNK